MDELLIQSTEENGTLLVIIIFMFFGLGIIHKVSKVKRTLLSVKDHMMVQEQPIIPVKEKMEN